MIINDTYGGWGAHGYGGYIVRQATKSVMASGLARCCIARIPHAIGVPPGIIAINLDLKQGANFRFQKSAAYGHFGRDDPNFNMGWETVKLLKPEA
ncbi:hypothetical protein CRYUN_Cryun25bG0121100 [Craigia yunnanensis]